MLLFWRTLIVDGGWWVWEFGKGRRVVRLGTWERWECGEVGKVGREQRGRMELPLELHVPFWRIVVRKFLWWGDHQRKKFFINNSVETLIPFKGKHQGLYWKCMYFWGGSGGFDCGKKMSLSPKKEIFLKQKKILWGGILESIEILLIFSRRLEVLIKKMERQQKKRFYSETQGNAVWGGLMKILWNSPFVTVLWKLFLSRDVSLLVCEIGWLG